MKKLLLLLLVTIFSCQKDVELCNCTVVSYDGNGTISKEEVIIDCNAETAPPSEYEREDPRGYYIICE